MQNNISDLFGLTQKQTQVLFSIEYLMVKQDILETKNEKQAYNKKVWAAHWKDSIESLLSKDGVQSRLYNERELKQVVEELLLSNIDKMWYHLVILEAVAFEGYTPLNLDGVKTTKNLNKTFNKLKYKSQKEYLKNRIIPLNHIISPELVDRYEKTFTKSLNKGLGRTQKIINRGLIILATSALFAATAGASAPALAVAIKGSTFSGLSGAALVSASLAALGGGAIAFGGSGIAGGLFVLVGGGALLGGIAGSAGVASATTLAKNSPDFTITQGAKLSVVLKEIILNNQKDIVNAQKVLANLKDEIKMMNNELQDLRLEKSKDKVQIKNLEKAITGLEKLYQDNRVFESSFEIGLKEETGDKDER